MKSLSPLSFNSAFMQVTTIELTAKHPSCIHCNDITELNASRLLERVVKQQYIYMHILDINLIQKS